MFMNALDVASCSGCGRLRPSSGGPTSLLANTGDFFSITVVTIPAGPLPLLRSAATAPLRWPLPLYRALGDPCGKMRDEGGARMWHHKAVSFLRCRPNSVVAGER